MSRRLLLAIPFFYLIFMSCTRCTAEVSLCNTNEMIHCKTCLSNNTCRECKDGYFGSTCSYNCSDGCAGHRCEKTTGKCSWSCKYGFFGDFCCRNGNYGINCTQSCPEQCIRCTSESVCNECKEGYYGSTCTKRCSSGCRFDSCNQETGKCSSSSCDSDHYGDMCCPEGMHATNCSLPCPYPCTKCTSDEECTACEPGFFGKLCAQSCSVGCQSTCKMETGECMGFRGCREGYYGDFCCPFGKFGTNCSSTCPDHCRGCTSDSKCTECEPGYYGIACNSRCPEGCKKNTCDFKTGECTNGCLSGYYGHKCCKYGTYGDRCNTSCPENCKECSSDLYCSECDSGYFGSTCSNRCSEGCSQHWCRKENGRCLNGCLSGFHGDFCCPFGKYGIQCNLTCPPNCVECTTDSTCSKCKVGYYGALCDSKCSPGCSKHTCEKVNGVCLYRCLPGHHGDFCCPYGFYGRNCSSKCPAHCKECTSNISCTECEVGYFGTSCSKQCSAGCKNKECRQENGECVSRYNCQPGHSGPFCCVNGKYGSECKSDCLPSCLSCSSSSTCEKCKSGYYGSTCTKQCPHGCRLEGCDQGSGACQGDLCLDGYYGDYCCPFGMRSSNCTARCPLHCTKCTSDIACSNCEPGYYGATCSRQCPVACRNGTCSIEGLCLYGCEDGYYGSTCQKQCSELCKNYRCDWISGTCSDGCVDGYFLTNTACVEVSTLHVGAASYDEKGPGNTSPIRVELLVGGIVGVAGIALAVSALAVLVRQRRRLRRAEVLSRGIPNVYYEVSEPDRISTTCPEAHLVEAAVKQM